MNGVTTSFSYDARNRVIRRTVTSGGETTTTRLTYSGWNLIEEPDGTGEIAQVYVHEVAIDELLVKFTPDSAVYYHYDSLGSTIALTDESGQVVESYTYDAFGKASVLDPSSLATRPSSLFGNRFL